MFSLNDYLAGAGQGKFDALSSLYENAFICAHRVIALNLKATQSLMEGNLSEVKALLDSRDAASLYQARSDMAHKLIQQAVGYAVGYQEVVAENQQKLSNLSAATGADGTPAPPGASVAPWQYALWQVAPSKLGAAPAAVETVAIDVLSRKASAVISNVPSFMRNQPGAWPPAWARPWACRRCGARRRASRCPVCGGRDAHSV